MSKGYISNMRNAKIIFIRYSKAFALFHPIRGYQTEFAPKVGADGICI